MAAHLRSFKKKKKYWLTYQVGLQTPYPAVPDGLTAPIGGGGGGHDKRLVHFLKGGEVETGFTPRAWRKTD